MRLNLGCGSMILAGWVNVDRWQVPGVDEVMDLDAEPWPWPAGSVSEIMAHDVFEHVADPLWFMSEAGRVLVSGGELHVKTTFWGAKSGYTDPTHKRWCTEETFDYWVPGTPLSERYGAQYNPTGQWFLKMGVEVSGDLLIVELRKR